MTLIAYKYFNQGYDNAVYDFFVSKVSTYMMVIGRIRTGTTGTMYPNLMKLSTVDYTLINQ